MNQANPLAFARHSLIAYTIAFRRDYRAAQLHYRIASALERVERGECRRLMIFVPPRHGKSMLTSEHFPAWYLGRHAERSIVCATYAQDLADDFGRKVRNQMIDPLYASIFPECAVASDSASISRIATQQHGNYYAVGIGGALTGRGANVLLIDDPHKDRAEADSEVFRKRAKDWYQSVAYTRLMQDASVVLMMTRWHEDDLAGWLLRDHPDENWEQLCIPASVEEAPWPERFPATRLVEIRRMVGPREWSALYEQQPQPAGGGEFRKEWMRHYRQRPTRGTNNYILVDPANEKKPDSDYTAMFVIGCAGDQNYYVLDFIRDRLSLTQRADALFKLHREYRPLMVGYEKYGLQADIEHMRDRMEREQYRFPITELGGTLKKEDRIRRLVPLFEQSRIWFPERHSYTQSDGELRELVRDFIEEEMAPFPVGRHDDMLDCLARITDERMPVRFPAVHTVREIPQPRAGGWMAS